MESRYCHNDDYTFAAEKLKYKFVPRGHYVVRQGEKEADVYFIIQGSAKVLMTGVEDPNTFLNEKQRYNEIALFKAKMNRQKLVQTAEKVTQAMSTVLSNINTNMSGFMTKI